MKILYIVILVIVGIIAVTAIGTTALFFAPFYGIISDIEQFDEKDLDNFLTKTDFIEYTQSQFFMDKYPKYTEEFHNTGFVYEYWIKSDDATLKIEFDQETEDATFVYTCTNSDGEGIIFEGNVKDTLPPLC